MAGDKSCDRSDDWRMHDGHMIEKMRNLKEDMLFVAEKLDERGNIDNSEHLRGAANILQTCIDGIQDNAGCNSAAL